MKHVVILAVGALALASCSSNSGSGSANETTTTPIVSTTTEATSTSGDVTTPAVTLPENVRQQAADLFCLGVEGEGSPSDLLRPFISVGDITLGDVPQVSYDLVLLGCPEQLEENSSFRAYLERNNIEHDS